MLSCQSLLSVNVLLPLWWFNTVYLFFSPVIIKISQSLRFFETRDLQGYDTLFQKQALVSLHQETHEIIPPEYVGHSRGR